MRKKYRSKPIEIEAERITAQNFRELAKWCKGDAFGGGLTRALEKICYWNSDGNQDAFRGDWLIKLDPSNFVHCTDAEFHQCYTEI